MEERIPSQTIKGTLPPLVIVQTPSGRLKTTVVKVVRGQEQNSNRFPTNSKTKRRADFDDRLPFRGGGHYRFKKRGHLRSVLYVVVLLKIIALFPTLAIIVLLRRRRRRRLVDKHGY